MKNDKNIELIERYLSDELSDTEKQTLDQSLAEDKNLAEAFQSRQMAHTALDYLIAKNLKSQLQELENENKVKVISINRNRKSRLVILSLAASVLLLIGAFYFLLPQGSKANAELASAYYEMPDLTIRGTDTANSDRDLVKTGIAALQNKEYDTAIAVLKSIPESNTYHVLAQYYLGHTFYATKQYGQAAESFDKVVASNDLRYLEDAQWYELLSCLAQHSDCTALLNKLAADPNHAYHSKALAIRKQIK